MIDVIQSDIERISLDILKECNALDVFPTPIAPIISAANLKVEATVDLHTVDKEFLQQLPTQDVQKFLDAIRNVRGILDRSHKTIYLDYSQIKTRLKFIQLHEVGHEVLHWQNETMCYLDDDETLHPDIKEQFEKEANYFASITLFQHDRFFREIEKYPFGIEAALKVSTLFGASTHATLRRYVEYSNTRCALLVLKDVSPKGSLPICYIRDYFQSKNFTEAFGEIQWPLNFGYTWPFVPLYYHQRRYSVDKEIFLNTDNGQVSFDFHFFNNTYNAFVLLFPKGEDKLITRSDIHSMQFSSK